MADYETLVKISTTLNKTIINQIRTFKYDVLNLEIDKVTDHLINNEYDQLKHYILYTLDIEQEQYYILSGLISQLELVNYLIMNGG